MKHEPKAAKAILSEFAGDLFMIGLMLFLAAVTLLCAALILLFWPVFIPLTILFLVFTMMSLASYADRLQDRAEAAKYAARFHNVN